MNLDLMLGIAVAIVGWYVVHRLEVARSRAAKRQELKTQYLLEAYRRLATVARTPTGSERHLESAIDDIQLLGSAHQIELVEQLAATMKETGGGSVSVLLEDLRRSLRSELDLETTVPVTVLRAHRLGPGALPHSAREEPE